MEKQLLVNVPAHLKMFESDIREAGDKKAQAELLADLLSAYNINPPIYASCTKIDGKYVIVRHHP